MTPECLKDLNTLMNALIMIGGQYKACMRDFIAANDNGIADFLRAEKMERYELSSCVADYIQQENKKGVVYSALPAPTHGPATPAALKIIIDLEKKAIDNLDAMITAAAGRGAEITKQFMVYVRNKWQKEFMEIHGIISEITKLAADPGAMAYYNNFLEEEYKRGHE